jgi:transketolase
VASVPSIGLFMNHENEYRKAVIPQNIPAFGLTSGLPSTLRRVVPTGTIFGLDHFGASAPYKILDEKFGFTPENVAKSIMESLK